MDEKSLDFKLGEISKHMETANTRLGEMRDDLHQLFDGQAKLGREVSEIRGKIDALQDSDKSHGKQLGGLMRRLTVLEGRQKGGNGNGAVVSRTAVSTPLKLSGAGALLIAIYELVMHVIGG